MVAAGNAIGRLDLESAPMLHFVGFRGDEYLRAVRIWGRPDYFHRNNDARIKGETAPGDILIYANGSEGYVNLIAFNDSEWF